MKNNFFERNKGKRVKYIDQIAKQKSKDWVGIIDNECGYEDCVVVQWDGEKFPRHCYISHLVVLDDEHNTTFSIPENNHMCPRCKQANCKGLAMVECISKGMSNDGR